MKIRDRLSVSFSVVASITLLVFGLAIYFFFSLYRKGEFNNRLKQRIEVTEKMFLEKENFSEQAFLTIQQQFLNKLPEETEEVVELTDAYENQIKQAYPKEFLSDLLADKEAFFETDDLQGAGRLFHVNGKDYLVILTATDYVGRRLMGHFLTIIFIGLAVCILAMIVVSHGISSRILNSILQKIEKANSISAKNLHERLEVKNPDDELGQLAIAFNHLLDRVAVAFETQKSFVDSASHEIRNPLTAIMGETEFALQRERSKEEYIHSLQIVSEEADRLNSLVNSLLKLSNISSKATAMQIETLSVYETLKSSLEKLTFLNADQKVKLNLGANESALIMGNIHLLETAFINLMDNACKFSYNGPVMVTLNKDSEDSITISIVDEGIGIPEEDIPKLIQPFHRANNARKIDGIGIGIPLTAKIIELHRGSLLFKSQLNKGTEVQITLPLARI